MARLALLLLLATLGTFSVPHWADAQDVHVVREGETLSGIARRYHVTSAELARLNRLAPGAPLRIGQELTTPTPNTVTVRSGQTLSSVARAAGCTVAELARLNRLREGATLRIGQTLRLPGAPAASAPTSRWGSPRNRGTATFIRGRTRTRIRLVDARGRVRSAAVRSLQTLMRGDLPRRRAPSPPNRLLNVLAAISDHFGGRPIRIVSGIRQVGGYTRDSSQHTRGHAVDIQVVGVPNTALRDFARTLHHVGVGYYPRSTFVHIDVRDRNTYWVDWSRPGEAPRYQRRGEAPPEDASPDERTETGEGGDDVQDEAEADIPSAASAPESAEPVAPAAPTEPAAS